MPLECQLKAPTPDCCADDKIHFHIWVYFYKTGGTTLFWYNITLNDIKSKYYTKYYFSLEIIHHDV